MPIEQDPELTFLIVDDDEGHRELMLRNLRRAGLQNRVDMVENGSAALDYVFGRGVYAERAQDGRLLVLLDINMPGKLDGIEVLRQIKARPESARIPVIMLTTADDPREMERCRKLGCSVYVTKPWDAATFVEAIRQLGL